MRVQSAKKKKWLRFVTNEFLGLPPWLPGGFSPGASFFYAAPRRSADLSRSRSSRTFHVFSYSLLKIYFHLPSPIPSVGSRMNSWNVIVVNVVSATEREDERVKNQSSGSGNNSSSESRSAGPGRRSERESEPRISTFQDASNTDSTLSHTATRTVPLTLHRSAEAPGLDFDNFVQPPRCDLHE